MAYDIEVMSLGSDLYPLLQSSIDSINAVQKEFRFRLSSPAQRLDGVAFTRNEYLTEEVWAFLRDQRKKYGGNRPHIVAFVDARLKSSALGNIFGSHQAVEGLAVVTVRDCRQYVKEARRFCSYYLARYALSFVNPLIKSHDDPARATCYFHKKLYKPDIRASMDSGDICDEDQHLLDNPPPGTAAKRLSNDEREALRLMRDVIRVPIRMPSFSRVAASRGWLWQERLPNCTAISTLIDTSERLRELLPLSFSPVGTHPANWSRSSRKRTFETSWMRPGGGSPSMSCCGGCYAGEHARSWINEHLVTKLGKQDEIKMKDLNGAIIYATRRGAGTLVFDSVGERQDTVAAFAARCSMSIPFFFVPQMVEGRRAFDGGLRNNFPVSRFLDDHPQTPFIALYLASPNGSNRGWIGSELLDIWIDGEDRRVVDKHAESVVVIDTSPIGTIDFNLTPLEKEFLLKIGKASALKFLQRRKLDDGPTDGVVTEAIAEAERCRQVVIQMRSRRRRKRIGVLILTLALATTYFLWR